VSARFLVRQFNAWFDRLLAGLRGRQFYRPPGQLPDRWRGRQSYGQPEPQPDRLQEGRLDGLLDRLPEEQLDPLPARLSGEQFDRLSPL